MNEIKEFCSDNIALLIPIIVTGILLVCVVGYEETENNHKVQLKQQQEYIGFLKETNQALLCDNERLKGVMDSLQE